MSDELKKTLPRIRTFAADFEHDRKESGLPIPDGVTVPITASAKAPSTSDLPTNAVADLEKEVPAIPINSHVPAFHELKKRSSSDNVTTPAQILNPATATSAKTVLVRNQKPVSVGGATIITDNKRAEQKLIPTIIASLGNWLKSLSANSKQKHAPKYTVIDTERRKGVIQKATTKTGTIFSADNETLKEEIRRRNWKHYNSDATGLDVTWSPNTDVGYPLLGSGLPQPANIAVEFKKRTEPNLPVITPPPLVVVPPPVYVEPTIPEPVFTQKPTVVEPIAQPTFVAPVATTPPPFEEIEPVSEYPLTTPEAHYRIKSIGDVTKLNTNILSIGVVGAIAGVVVVVIIGNAILGFIFNDTIKITMVPATPIGYGTVVTDIALDTPTQEALIIALQQIPANEKTKQEFRMTDATGTPLEKQVVLPLLGLSNTGSLNRTINEVRILHTGTTRGVIFTVTDATTAFGSLLAWEGYMVDTLGPILNISRPSEPLTVADRTLQNTDLRIFTANNQEVLVYGFINANTVLITKDTPSFTAALGSQ